MKNSKLIQSIINFTNGDFILTTKNKPHQPRRDPRHHEISLCERYEVWKERSAESFFKGIYTISSFVICFTVIAVLLMTVSFLPEFGNPENPVNNEVSQRYIEKGLEETGAVNIVAGMILDYRAFDTFGESAVLFTAATCVMALLKKDPEEFKLMHTPPAVKLRDPIIKNVAQYIIPMLLIFGIYVVLNGHISPGGGFSGGAIMGTSLFLYSSAFGYRQAEKVITEKIVKNTICVAFGFYAIAKGYSFITGANHLPTGIPLGEPGAILSSGLILPLNICVGLIVTCTIYSFYSLFSRGKI